MSHEGREFAIKIYKTSILIFKDRDRYVTGEFRFRNGYARSNPRKMVAMWAEKEYRNLLRLSQAGIHAPVPRAQRQHVLVMDFIGDDGNAASRLKGAVGQYQLTKEQLTRIYWDTADIMKKMYQDCRLVHADLSEYNLLYFVKTEELWVIDVSQSVEHDHPHSLEFLRRDADIINKFFRHYDVHTLSARELFDYIVDAGLVSLEKRAAHVEKQRAMCEGRSMADIPDDQVFLRTYIPRTLQQMTLKMFTPDQEEDPEPTAGGTATSMEAAYYSYVTGIKTAAGEESENGKDEEESDEEEEMKKEEMEEERKKAKEEEDGKTMKRQAKRELEKQRLNGLPVLPPTLILRPLSDYFTIPLFTTAQDQNSSFSAFNTATSNKVNCVPFGLASDAVWQASNGNRQRASEDAAGQAESSSDWNSDSEEDELTSSDSESLEEEDVGVEQPEGEEPKKEREETELASPPSAFHLDLTAYLVEDEDVGNNE
ncbi:putative serine/threonine protein kinase [Blattamonas nauphoetae]|uniref:non-specific serine/threonine protein kinase n=1 Tax=Blattamonas nauphoetae TaxID=2049346 RepID=A0ABQ9YFG0_9EUKA|nr:putative serine/threonine protein kinase [Blattamonas nauphoetae]